LKRNQNGLRWMLVVGVLLVHSAALAQYPCPGWSETRSLSPDQWGYTIKFQKPDTHLLVVQMNVPALPSLEVQMPAWNALYQIRDFSEHINWIRASDANDKPVAVRQVDKNTWSVPGARKVEYEIAAVESGGPFGAEYTPQHAFLNLAQVLMYPVGQSSGVVYVRLAGLPNDWRVGTSLAGPTFAVPEIPDFCADSYDHLVDSPLELSDFHEDAFTADGAQFRVVIHGNSDDYDSGNVLDTLKRIVNAEIDWMHDRPFRQYTFIIHFPRGLGRGGMEHAYSTAIETSAGRLTDDPLSFASVSAHEFFHLWNVKRIRPKSLANIDYTKENYTRALWFSEGVDSAVAEYMLVRAGITDEKTFLQRLADAIKALESRPARMTQSAEESSLNSWLEKYAYYRSPERSVNYYNKGQILGVLLDLSMREQTHGQKSLRDLLQWMNDHYAKEGKFFDDSDGVRQSTEAVTGGKFEEFFRKYVGGTDEIPYDNFFQFVGLNLQQKHVATAYAGFSASANFGPTPIVTGVDSGGEAEKAGLHPGDIILSINGQEPQSDFEDQIAGLDPGSTIKLRVSTRDRTHEVKIKTVARRSVELEFVDVPGVTSAQQTRRAAWIRGDSETTQGH
jgi:predicted metalloprotease with PDZ domain